MKPVECEGCGAPLVLHRQDCEYCRRIHTYPLQLGYAASQALYNQQMNNPNPLSQLFAMNSQGQAAADYYNSMNSAWSGIGGAFNGWFGGS